MLIIHARSLGRLAVFACSAFPQLGAGTDGASFVFLAKSKSLNQ
jgi:RNA processing factor Prp31